MPAPLLERARSLFAEGRFQAGLSAIGPSVPAEPSLALLYAEALIETGQHQRAIEVITSIETHHAANAAVMAATYRVSAAVLLEQGNQIAAAERLKSAIALAEASGDLPEAARAALRFFTYIHSSSGRDSSTEALAAVKRLVLRSNRPSLLTDLHSRVGQAEAQSGRLVAAQHHLRRALARIIRQHP
jgi:tetratricopeptide (TPR) repeat protein